MTRPLRPWLFVAIALVTAACAYLAWFVVIDRVVVRPVSDVGDSWKTYLLANTSPPRLLIDGGSSSHFGIDGERLTAGLGRTTLNLADNAGYPLLHKLHRLRPYVQRGDAVLLPVEWYQYTLDAPPSTYLDDLTSSLSPYYHALPLHERIDLARRITYRAWVRGVFELLVGIGRSPGWADSRVQRLQAHKDSDRSGGFCGIDFPLAPDARPDCDTYLLMNAPPGADVSAGLLAAFDELAAWQREGIDVRLTAPVVVGDACYATHADRYDDLLQQVSRAASARGLRWLEQPASVRLPDRYYRDTPYHPIAAGRILRSDALMAQLVPDLALPNSAPLQAFDDVADQLAARLVGSAYDTESCAEQFAALDLPVTFESGWSTPEATGRWSEGAVSQLAFDLPPEARGRGMTLRFEATYFATPEATGIDVCGHDVGATMLDRTPLVLPDDVLRACSGPIVMTLHHHTPVSPADLSMSSDPRKLKLWLASVAYDVLPMPTQERAR